MKQVWDISRLLTKELAPWPGDRPFDFELTSRIGDASSVNIGALSMSVHNGTHADAPFHFDNNGATIEALPLAAYVGTATVVDLSGKFGEGSGTITAADFTSAQREIASTRRLLIKTNCFPDSSCFPTWIPVLEPDAIVALREWRVVLVGVDVPSVDSLTAKTLSNHHALHAAGICIVESLDLRNIGAGEYQLAAMPLPVRGGDGAPVRAVLWRNDPAIAA